VTGEQGMTVAEFGQRIRVSPTTAWRKVRDGEIAAVNVGSRKRPRLRITETALTQYLAERRVA
jgi:excisionase family DNA binding protein